jgi:parvulin-like peptidyl-prolyl isomerase
LAKKSVPQKPAREMTRRRMATWQKQKRRQRLILFTGVGLIIIALLTVLIGWIASDAVPRAKTVLVVNGVEYTAGDCVTAVFAYANPTAEQVGQVIDQVVPAIQQKEIIAQESVALGVEVTDEDIKSALDLSGLGKKYRRFLELDLIEQAVVGHFYDQVPITTPQRQIYAMLLEDEVQAEAARQQLLEGEDFVSLAEMISISIYTKEDGGDLGWHPQGFSQSADKLDSEVPLDWAWQAAEGDLSPVLADPDVLKQGAYWIWMVTERDAEKGSHVYGMKFGEMAAAQSAYDRFQAGEDFATLALEVSQYTESPEGDPGEIGWYLNDNLVTSMQTFVPDAALNTPSQPIRDSGNYSDGGYWVVKVAGVDEARAVSLDDIQTISYAAYNEWLERVTDDSKHQIENNWTDVREWVIKQVTAEAS